MSGGKRSQSLQGAAKMFPISSLGHSVPVPAWFGGSWQTSVTQSSQAGSESSFYLACIVALHCATALALLWFFRADWMIISATIPVILAAGVLKVPSLASSAGAHIHGQVIVGFIVCGIAGYLPVRFLLRWSQTRTLTPFAICCLAFGLASVLRFI